MGKITVKHYLNVNLKPYVVKGESYYSIYIMVVVNRKNTKVKSVSFEELYTEKDFEEIQSEDNDLLKQEIRVIENICTQIQDTFGDFDASLFSAYYSLLNDLFIDSIDFEGEPINGKFQFWNKERNKFNLNIESFVFGDFSLNINKTHGMNLFVWFSEDGQKRLYDYIVNQGIVAETEECVYILNKLVFLGSMEGFSRKLNETKKGRELYEKYSETIDNDFWRYYESLYEKYGLDN